MRTFSLKLAVKIKKKLKLGKNVYFYPKAIETHCRLICFYCVILSYFARIKSPFSKRSNLVSGFIILDCQKLILRSKAFIIDIV